MLFFSAAPAIDPAGLILSAAEASRQRAQTRFARRQAKALFRQFLNQRGRS